MVNSFEFIKFKIENNVATITLNRPKKGNSLNVQMGDELNSAIKKVYENDEIHVVVLTGEESLKNCPKPIICKINGPVFGGGIGIVFCCDFRIITKQTYFSFAEVKRGLIPALISAFIVPELGSFKSKSLMISGKKVNSEEAFKLGFISEIAEDLNDLNRIIDNYLIELSSSAPFAMREIKKTIGFVDNHSHEENLKYTKTQFKKMIVSKEAKYGLGCFSKKQKPNWKEFHSKL